MWVGLCVRVFVHMYVHVCLHSLYTARCRRGLENSDCPTTEQGRRTEEVSASRGDCKSTPAVHIPAHSMTTVWRLPFWWQTWSMDELSYRRFTRQTNSRSPSGCYNNPIINVKRDQSIERFSKPNFGSIQRFRTMTGLEIENWIEKRGRTVRKFRSTRPRTESNFRFGLTSCRSQDLPTKVRSLLCHVFDSFSLLKGKFAP